MLGPSFQAHLLNQAQIEHFDIVGQIASLVSIWMQVVAGKLIAVAAKSETLFVGTFISCTMMRFTEDLFLNWYLAIVAATTFTKHCLNRNLVFAGYFLNYSHGFPVLFGQIEMAIETIQAAWSGHLKIVHGQFPPSLNI
jgi:hypothetical protein